MRRGLRAFAAIACAALSVGIAAPAATSAGAAEPLRMTVGTLGTIGSLDPRTGDSVVAREVWKIQYPTLTAVDPTTLRPTAGVASAWTPLANDRGWRYELRPQLTWSDGKPVTATDVVYSLEHARDDFWPYAHLGLFDGLTARAVDARTVVVTARSQTRLLPELPLHVVPAHVYERHASVDDNVAALGVADGAWHVVSRSSDAVTLGVLGRPGGPPLDEIVFRTYSSTDAVLDALARGDVDVIANIGDENVDRLHALDGVTVNRGDLEDRTVEAFRTDNVTGFLPEPSRPSLIVFGPTITQYSGIVAASPPPGEQLSNLTYAIAAVVLAALCVVGYWIASRLRRRFVT